MTTGDLYNLLGLSAKATPDEVRAAYHQAARRFHPDTNPSPGAVEEFKLVADAYAILSDASQRATYDAAVEQTGSGPLLAIKALYSQDRLPALAEPQVVYVLLEIQPSILADLPEPPLNLCLVIDRSTSMQGNRLDQVKGAVLQVLDNLKESDTFSVVTFSDRAEVIVPAQRGLAERTLSKAKISTVSAGGGTEILQGLLSGLTELHRHISPAGVNHLLLLTDGRTYGDEADCLMLAHLAASDGIAISGLGIGDEWNDAFVDALTGRTGGTATYISAAQNVAGFIQERVRGLGATFAERLNVQVTLDPGMELASVFRVSPDSGPVPIEQPLQLGSLPKNGPSTILFKFRLPPLAPGKQNIARLSFFADVVSLGRRGERMALDLALPVVQDASPSSPPQKLVDALGRLSQYQMQERAWQQAAAGDVDGATERLKTLGTRLLASGQPELARLALSEASRLEKTRVLSEDAKKKLKYGTRALMSEPPAATRRA
ncbi:MAG: DnaJ domain-containing protein [Anaerolineales bacterium]